MIFLLRFVPDVDPPVNPVQGDMFSFSTSAGDFDDFSPISMAIRGTGISGRGVSELALDPVSGYLYATSRISAFVHVLDTNTGLPEAVIPVSTVAGGIDSRALVVAPDGSEVYVANRLPDSLLVLSTAAIPVGPAQDIVDDAILDAIAIGSRPSDVTLTADGSHILVTCNGDGTVYAIERATRSVIAISRVGDGAFTMALSLDGSLLFVGNYNENSISVMDADPASPDFMRVLTTIEN